MYSPVYEEANGPAHKAYRGVQTWEQAEKLVMKMGDFILYHRYPLIPDIVNLSKLSASLKMYVCYRSSKGSYRHYRIHSTRSYTEPFFFVECGDPKPKFFRNLDALVQYHQRYGNIFQSDDEPPCADLFPWWKSATVRQ
ncbi:unnamed protein product, partial [Mesorhabditis spiculigera]